MTWTRFTHYWPFVRGIRAEGMDVFVYALMRALSVCPSVLPSTRPLVNRNHPYFARPDESVWIILRVPLFSTYTMGRSILAWNTAHWLKYRTSPPCVPLAIFWKKAVLFYIQTGGYTNVLVSKGIVKSKDSTNQQFLIDIHIGPNVDLNSGKYRISFMSIPLRLILSNVFCLVQYETSIWRLIITCILISIGRQMPGSIETE